jgi:putative protease
VLAPAGDADSLRAALASGADAVYFGLDDGFNARARADNFSLAELPATVALIHRAGARAYLTTNTLVFESELDVVERILIKVAAAGVDALIIQDPAVALLAREICPQLELHGSTQMTLSSAEGARFAASLGITRIVVPRELSIGEIARLAAATELELEVFIHGALCVSWSGQCLSSEAWGGRSANRGQCAQSCRMPYQLVVDGRTRDLGELRYLLSPRDLAGLDAVEPLARLGVHGLKIEGRQKGAVYVATAVAAYRRQVDAVAVGRSDSEAQARDREAMSLAYSRGFGAGFLGGVDHQSLVDGRFPKHRGVLAGRVLERRGHRVRIAPTDFQVQPGMGVVFDAGHPEDPDEPGGPVFAAEPAGAEGEQWLRFGVQGPALEHVQPGDRVWVTSDPRGRSALAERLARGEPAGRIAARLMVCGAAGQPLQARLQAAGHEAHARSKSPLSPARGEGLYRRLLEAKLGALGSTPFRLDALEMGGLAAGLHLPVSELKALRRRLVARLAALVERGPTRVIAPPGALARLRAAAFRPPPHPDAAAPPALVPLCRSDEQLEAVIAAGLPEVELDWMELHGLGRAVRRARSAGLRTTIATVRVQKPGEEGYDRRLAALEPDGVLVRHLGALMSFAEQPGSGRPALHGDFSLNVTNSLSARHLLALGLDTVTAAHDLDAVQLAALLGAVPADRLIVVLHHHIPTFHTEHCVYAHLLSSGRDFTTCGRPCERSQVALRDHLGLEHPVVVDVGCRNTVFNAQAQSAAPLVPRLRAQGVRRFRVEFVREDRAQAARVLSAYTELLAGVIAPAEAIRRVGVHEQFGVTRGTMRVLG